jgi:uridine kinase
MNNSIPEEYKFVTPRPTVELHLPDGRVICGQRGAAVGDFLSLLEEPVEPPLVGAIINGELRELTFPIHMDAKVIPISMEDADGMLIYRRSLTFLLEAAFEDLFPDATLTIDHSVSSGGYYCEVKDHAPLIEDDLANLTAHMKSIVEENIKFSKREVPLAEAGIL